MRFTTKKCPRCGFEARLIVSNAPGGRKRGGDRKSVSPSVFARGVRAGMITYYGREYEGGCPRCPYCGVATESALK